MTDTNAKPRVTAPVEADRHALLPGGEGGLLQRNSTTDAEAVRAWARGPGAMAGRAGPGGSASRLRAGLRCLALGEQLPGAEGAGQLLFDAAPGLEVLVLEAIAPPAVPHRQFVVGDGVGPHVRAVLLHPELLALDELQVLREHLGGEGQAGLLLSRGGGEGGRGFWTQNLVYQKWPDQIFPIVNFVFSHDGHFGLGRGGGGFGGGVPPPPWFLIILKKPWGGASEGGWGHRAFALARRAAVDLNRSPHYRLTLEERRGGGTIIISTATVLV